MHVLVSLYEQVFFQSCLNDVRAFVSSNVAIRNSCKHFKPNPGLPELYGLMFQITSVSIAWLPVRVPERAPPGDSIVHSSPLKMEVLPWLALISYGRLVQ